MVDINARERKKNTNKIARGQIGRAGSLLQIAPYRGETPVLRLVTLPVCLKSWSERSDPCNN
jgi:hypothetical protein